MPLLANVNSWTASSSLGLRTARNRVGLDFSGAKAQKRVHKSPFVSHGGIISECTNALPTKAQEHRLSSSALDLDESATPMFTKDHLTRNKKDMLGATFEEKNRQCGGLLGHLGSKWK